jgi:hypothetical protein
LLALSPRLLVAIGRQLLWQTSLVKEESPTSSSMVNFIAIIVRRSDAMSLKPC